MKFLAAISVLVLLPFPLEASRVQGHSKPCRIDPAHPKVGESMRVHYVGTDRFAGDAEIFAMARFTTSNGSRAVHARLVRDDSDAGTVSWSADIQVPETAVYAYVHVVSRSGRDAKADLETMIYEVAGEPRREARLSTVFANFDRLDAIVAAELAAHPDNFAAYRTKWFAKGIGQIDAALRELVTTDMAGFADRATPSALWARSYGHMILGEERKARALVLGALREFPEELATARAVSDYQYQCYAQNVTGLGPRQVRRAMQESIAAHANTFLARKEIRLLAAKADVPLGVTRAVCRKWMQDRPLDPEPKLVLARALFEKRTDLKQADDLARAAARGYMGGDTRLCGDATGSTAKMMLPSALSLASDTALTRGDLAGALGYALAAQRVTTQMSPLGYEAEARCWARFGDRAAAAKAYARAFSAGSKIARATLGQLFQDGVLRANSDSSISFESWLDELTAEERDEKRWPAAPFRTKRLDGTEVSLSALRGRVVVLNFWGLGCAPCKVEIPDLNRLVEAYAGKPITFLALGTDGPEEIRSYLREHPFQYEQVAESVRIAGLYQVQAWPTHVIIDKGGRVAATFVGGCKDVRQRFGPLLDRLLREPGPK